MTHRRRIGVPSAVSLWLLLMAASGGCHHVAPAARMAAVPTGATFQAVCDAAGQEPEHQFTAALDDGVYRCVEYAVTPDGGRTVLSHLYLFRDGRLVKVCRRPLGCDSFGQDEGGWRLNTREQVLERLDRVMAAPDLTGPALLRDAKREAVARERPPDGGDDLGRVTTLLLPVIIPLIPIALPSHIANGIGNARTRAKFDPRRIGLGWSVERVERRTGRPDNVRRLGDGVEARVYGPHGGQTSDLFTRSFVGPAAVWFKDDRAVWILSDAFASGGDLMSDRERNLRLPPQPAPSDPRAGPETRPERGTAAPARPAAAPG